MILMTYTELVEILMNIVKEKTLYVDKGKGELLTHKTKIDLIEKSQLNQLSNIKSKIIKSDKTYAFDNPGLVKAALEKWNKGTTLQFDDIPSTINKLFDCCYNVSTNFNDIQIGEAVWINHHIGIYAGEGNVVEATPKWNNGVQITKLENITGKTNKSRFWTHHGRFPWVKYKDQQFVFRIGDLICLNEKAKYCSGKKIPHWVKTKNWFIDKIEDNKVLINMSEDGDNKIMGYVPIEYITLVKNTCGIKLRQLKLGDSGTDVRTVQRILYVRGIKINHKRCNVTGIFDNNTLNYINKFQLSNGLETTGVVDSITWLTLMR